ncbi:MAG: hypothetical protein NTY64_20905, partial [Deltaproteobacteria bacterium]|nr:hypothetical protein [Deltaproteobacteria bacterium]
MDEADIQELHLMDYLQILRRRWIILLACLLVALYFFWTPVLRIHPLGQGYFPEFFWHEKWMNNQINILRSKQVAEKVVERLSLRLQMKPEERVYEVFVRDILQRIKENSLYQVIPEKWTFFLREIDEKFALPQFFLRPLAVSAGAREGLYQAEFQDPQHFLVYDPKGKKIGAGEVGKTFAGPNFSFILEGAGKTGERFKFQIMPGFSAIGAIQGSLVITPEKDSTMIHVGTKWDEPQMAGELANVIMECYLETLVAKKAKDVSQVLSYVGTQLTASDENLHRAEENLKRFKGQEKIIELDTQIRESLSQYTNYEKELSSLDSYRHQAEIVLATLKSPRSFNEREALYSLGAGLNDTFITSLSHKLSDLMVKKEALLSLYKDEHPKIQQIDSEVEITRRSIISGVGGLISSLKIKERTVQAALAKVEKKVQRIPAVEQEIYSLQRMVKVSQGVNDFLLQKQAELSVNKASVLPNVFIVEKAMAPGTYVGPNVEQKLLWALLIGAALGIGLAFLVEYFDTSVKTPEQVQ